MIFGKKRHNQPRDGRERVLLRMAREDAFLPLKRLQSGIGAWSAQYQSAEPFPHIVLDDLFDPELLACIDEEFPEPDRQDDWLTFRKDNEWLKNATAADRQIPFLTRHFLYALNSRTFIAWLEELTGIKGLIADTEFFGGGLHATLPGGRLEVHADFNKHLRNGLDRRLNLLLYLNRDWSQDWGGDLELWDAELKACRRLLAPVFNRMVIFSTTDFSFHGHPEPLRCPEGRIRKSIALYYFSRGRPPEEVSDAHLTNYRQRPAGNE